MRTHTHTHTHTHTRAFTGLVRSHAGRVAVWAPAARAAVPLGDAAAAAHASTVWSGRRRRRRWPRGPWLPSRRWRGRWRGRRRRWRWRCPATTAAAAGSEGRQAQAAADVTYTYTYTLLVIPVPRQPYQFYTLPTQPEPLITPISLAMPLVTFDQQVVALKVRAVKKLLRELPGAEWEARADKQGNTDAKKCTAESTAGSTAQRQR